LLKPEYNLNPIAVNSKGYKHTAESIEKLKNLAKGRKHKDETKKNMSLNRKGAYNSFYSKTHTNETKALMSKTALNRTIPTKKLGMVVEITDLITRTTTVYNSIRPAAKSIDSDIKTILRREKLQNLKGINTPYL